MTEPIASPSWSLESLRLPKAIENDAQGPALHAALRERAKKLWAGGAILVPTASWSDALAAALRSAQREGRLERGLERAERALQREVRGLSLADERSATERGSRVSRLLLVSNDGTERFYRQVERLVSSQGPRLLAIHIEADSGQFAAVVPQAAGVVRALLIEHKDNVARVLLALHASPAANN
jgi:hypothetical protein